MRVTVISGNTRTQLYSFSLEERKAERRLLFNGKLVVIMLKTMIKLNILYCISRKPPEMIAWPVVSFPDLKPLQAPIC